MTRKTTPKDQSLFDDFLPHLIARLAYQLNGDLVEKLRREGINVTRWRILAVLAMGDGITINEIIDRAMMQQSALSRALMNMEKEDYVRRVLRPVQFSQHRRAPPPTAPAEGIFAAGTHPGFRDDPAHEPEYES